MSQKHTSSWLGYAAVGVVSIVLSVGVYYFVYVERHTAQLEANALHELQVSGEYIQDALERLELNAENALRDARADSAAADTAHLPILANLRGIPAFSLPRLEERCEAISEGMEVPGTLSAGTRLLVQPEGRSASLVLDARRRARTGPICVTATADLQALLAPLLPTELFGGVVLSRMEGTVLLSEGQGPLEFAALPIAQLSSEGSDDSGAVRQAAPAASYIGQREIAGTAYRMFVQPIRVPVRAVWGPNETSEEIWLLAGFISASELRDAALSIPPNILLMVVGLFILIMLSLPFLKIIFLGPREALERHDIVILMIAAGVVSSTLTLGTFGLWTYYELQEHQVRQLERLAGSMARSFGDEISAFNRQLIALTGRVEDVLESGSPVPDTLALRTNLLRSETLAEYPFLEMAYWMGPRGEQLHKWGVAAQSTPRISLGDRTYFLQAKTGRLWPANDSLAPAPPTSSAGSAAAPGLRRLTTAPGYYLESIRSRNTGEVYAVLAHRIVDGAAEEAGGAGAIPETSRIEVAAAISPLLSLIDPVLPPGYGFAVIAEDGQVVFHQEASRNLRENLFAKIEGGENLAEVVASRTAQGLKADYGQSSYLFRFQPLEGTPWTLVVFDDMSSMRALYARILSHAAVRFIVYVSFLLLILVLAHKIRSPGARLSDFFIWMWPDRRKSAAYAGIAVAEAVVAAALLGVILLAANSVVVLGIAAVGVLIFHQRISACWTDSPAGDLGRHGRLAQLLGRRLGWRGSYYLALGLLVLVVSILPPISFLQGAFDEEMSLYSKRLQLQMVRGLQERVERHVERYTATQLGDHRDAMSAKLLPSVIGNESPPWDVHLAAVGTTFRELPAIAGYRDAAFDRDQRCHQRDLYLGIKGLLTSETPWMQGLQSYRAAEADDGSWFWTCGDRASLVLHFPAYRRAVSLGATPAATIPAAGLPVLQATSDVVRFRDLNPALLLVLGPLLLLGVFFYALMRPALRRVYLMDVLHPRSVDGQLLRLDGWRGLRNRLLIRQEVEHAEDVYAVAPAKLRKEGAETVLEEARQSQKSRVALWRFHEGLDDSEAAETKLALLEGLTDLEDKTIELSSAINPLHYFRMRAREEQSEAARSGLGRWAMVLTTFVRTRRALTSGNREEEIERYKQRLLDERRAGLGGEAGRADLGADGPVGDSTQEDPAVTQAIEWIAWECWPDPYLQRLGLLLSTHPELGDVDTREQAIIQVLDLAEAYYQHLWAISGTDEKIILYRIASEGFVSWNSRDLVQRLMYRGLVQARPQLEIINRSFRRFIRDAEAPEVYAQWERMSGARPWARIRGPVIAALLALLLFFLVTEPSILEQSVVLLTAAAASIPAALKVLTMLFHTGGGGRGEE